ncbi:MAG TPA: sigma-70 family RNA polymerase sigma factor, partial [Anaerolineales bacterium]|nr:sigma-70 family RNA polymerase sigma factor [Anaerolineales bacterium]
MANQVSPPPAVDFSTLSDTDLLDWIERAEETALGTLYDRYQRLVFSLAYQSIGEQGLAEEITQDVFLRIWEKAGTYRPDQGKVLTWIVSITRNRAIDMYRRQRIRPEKNSLDFEDLHPREQRDGVDIEAEVELSLQQQRIRAALASLPPEQRQALSLAFFRGFTHTEIAARLHEPLGTIKTRIRAAMHKLHHQLTDENSYGRDESY